MCSSLVFDKVVDWKNLSQDSQISPVLDLTKMLYPHNFFKWLPQTIFCHGVNGKGKVVIVEAYTVWDCWKIFKNNILQGF